MNTFIEEHIEWAYAFANHTVNNISNANWFNTNHLAKMLLAQTDVYKIIIDKILLDNKQFKNVQDMNELQWNT